MKPPLYTYQVNQFKPSRIQGAQPTMQDRGKHDFKAPVHKDECIELDGTPLMVSMVFHTPNRTPVLQVWDFKDLPREQ